jgi:Kef-type K+ transport system membrane component KefB
MSSTEDLLFSILLQLIVMIGAARIMNRVCRAMGQPGVIGEIVGGLMLGPSLVGHFYPGASAYLFGDKASAPITVISQIGLVFLMFQIGMDFDFAHLQNRRGKIGVVAVALCSILVPLGLGIAIGEISAPVLAQGIDPLTYSLFFGVALAITAVPILGRILREYGLTQTEVGVVAISAAAINDAVGWLLLAGISAYAASHFSLAVMGLRVGGLVLLGLVLAFVLRPIVNFMMRQMPVRNGELEPNLIAIVLCLILGLGICTYKIGIFTIFGGFAGGLLFYTHKQFVAAWHKQIGQFVLVFFLPVFFTFTGLRTNVLGLTSGSDYAWLALALTGAILGKMIPVYIAGRIAGFDGRQSSILATLMNTRALMELIVLNIGYDLGFLPQKVFTMLVIVAVVTTIMAGPLLKTLLPRAGYVIPVGVEA